MPEWERGLGEAAPNREVAERIRVPFRALRASRNPQCPQRSAIPRRPTSTTVIVIGTGDAPKGKRMPLGPVCILPVGWTLY